MKLLYTAAISAAAPMLPRITASAAPSAQGWTLAKAGRFFGYFLLVMAVIYGALLLTSWLGKKWGKK